MPIKAQVKYKIIKHHSYSNHNWLISMSDYYAGKTESAVLHHLKKRHGNDTNIVINSIDWK
tara:strand:+ start:185 stop:367 length:183 start_codon:yes stop_codon:yes gene_type:complete